MIISYGQSNKSLSSSKSESKNKDKETKKNHDENEEKTACEFSNLRSLDEAEYEIIAEDDKFIVVLEDKECEVSEVQAKLLGYESEEKLTDENDSITESDEDDESNSGSKIFLITLISLLVSGTGGGVYYYYYKLKKKQS